AWSVGETGSRFFREFKRKQIMGTRCPKCKRVLVPARKFCPRCFVDTKEWVPVSDSGKIRTYTIVYYAYPGQVRPPPYAIGVIDLDGADTGFSHYIGGLNLKDPDQAEKIIKIGGRVKATWKKKREGNIFDIIHFAPVTQK
ncbi:MAG: Zn-ribbon domain-containing OB-fold protein, partial [Candidatus Bathyarchaeia archaeon]